MPVNNTTINKVAILRIVQDTLADILHLDVLELKESDTTDNVKDWDSINHVRLLMAIESEFKFKFGTDEVGQIANVGELIDLIQKKINVE